MNRIIVTLKNGKEVKFESEQGNVFQALSHVCKDLTPLISYSDDEQPVLYINKDEIAAARLKPLVKCTHCGEWVEPDVANAYCGKGIIDSILTCPNCKLEIKK